MSQPRQPHPPITNIDPLLRELEQLPEYAQEVAALRVTPTSQTGEEALAIAHLINVALGADALLDALTQAYPGVLPLSVIQRLTDHNRKTMSLVAEVYIVEENEAQRARDVMFTWFSEAIAANAD